MTLGNCRPVVLDYVTTSKLATVLDLDLLSSMSSSRHTLPHASTEFPKIEKTYMCTVFDDMLRKYALNSLISVI